VLGLIYCLRQPIVYIAKTKEIEMDDLIKRHEAIKKKFEKLKSETARLEGALESVMQEAEKKYGCKTIDELSDKIDSAEDEIDELKKKIEPLLEKLEKEMEGK